MDDHNNTDNNPPRHAIESDDEDEFNPLQPLQPAATKPDVKLVGNVPGQRSLVVASGDPGAFWARGADLGEQTGAVAVNGMEIGLVFNPVWTEANVIISEAIARLPVWAMHAYAKFIIDGLQPTSVALLDEYSVPIYITTDPVPATDAPIRSLSTRSVASYAPPNLVNGTSASFLAILAISQSLGTLVLLPSPNTLKPAPRDIERISITHDMEWPSAIVNQAQQMVLGAISEPTDHLWRLTKPLTKTVRRSEIGEGGMYI